VRTICSAVSRTDRAAALEHAHLVDPGVEQADQRLPRQRVRGRAVRGGAHGHGDRRVGRLAGGEHALAQVGVRHHPEPVGALDERGGDAGLRHRARRIGHGRAGGAEERRPGDQRAEARRAQRGQRVDGVARAHEALAQAVGDVGRAVRMGERAQRRGAWDQHAGGGLPRAHREGGRQAGEDGGETEGLAGLQHVDHLVAVQQLDGARADDVQVLRRRGVLHERHLALVVAALRRRHDGGRELAGRQPVERRMAAEKRCEAGGVLAQESVTR
jgi:hypothetical protein